MDGKFEAKQKKGYNEIDAIKKNDAVQKGPFWDTSTKRNKERKREEKAHMR